MIRAQVQGEVMIDTRVSDTLRVFAEIYTKRFREVGERAFDEPMARGDYVRAAEALPLAEALERDNAEMKYRLRTWDDVHAEAILERERDNVRLREALKGLVNAIESMRQIGSTLSNNQSVSSIRMETNTGDGRMAGADRATVTQTVTHDHFTEPLKAARAALHPAPAPAPASEHSQT